jgi:biopolymer transport protein ExbD
MSFKLKKSRSFDSLNLTPFIDVVFFLLTYFLIASRFTEEDREMPVKLPTAMSALPMTVEPTELVINVDAKGGYVVRGEKMPLDRVASIIQQAVADNPINQMVVIRGDRNVAFQSVVSVMDLCTKLKVPAYKISTESMEGS